MLLPSLTPCSCSPGLSVVPLHHDTPAACGVHPCAAPSLCPPVSGYANPRCTLDACRAFRSLLSWHARLLSFVAAHPSCAHLEPLTHADSGHSCPLTRPRTFARPRPHRIECTKSLTHPHPHRPSRSHVHTLTHAHTHTPLRSHLFVCQVSRVLIFSPSCHPVRDHACVTIHLCSHTRVHAHTHSHTHLLMHVHARTRTYKLTHMYTYTRAQARTRAHPRACPHSLPSPSCSRSPTTALPIFACQVTRLQSGCIVRVRPSASGEFCPPKVPATAAFGWDCWWKDSEVAVSLA